MNRVTKIRGGYTDSGFTIVELMVATMVFSVIMLVAAGAVVRFTSNFQRGITASTTQNTARSVIDTISQSIQFYGSSDIRKEDGAYCIGSTSYRYVLGRQLNTDQKNVLVEQQEGLPIGCGGELKGLAASAANPAEQELLAPNMRLAKFDITKVTKGVFELTVRIAYGDNDLLCSTNLPGDCNKQDLNETDFSSSEVLKGLQCKGQKGSQYCAVSEITTTVQSRI